MHRTLASICILVLAFSTTATPIRAFMSPLSSPSATKDSSSSSSSPVSVVMTTRAGCSDNNSDNQNIDADHRLNPRNCIFNVGASAGQLCSIVNTVDAAGEGQSALVQTLANLMYHLHQTATALDLDLLLAIEAKMELNKLKYPVELCKGKAGKYTQYSKVTGVTATNQSTLDRMATHQAMPLSVLVDRLPALTQEIAAFAEARKWSQFHTPRNLILALLGEVGELAELVQWKGDQVLPTPNVNDDQDGANSPSSEALTPQNQSPMGLTSSELDKLSQELADVTIYSLRIATVCDIVDPVRNVLQEFVSLDEDASPQRFLAQDPSFGKD